MEPRRRVFISTLSLVNLFFFLSLFGCKWLPGITIGPNPEELLVKWSNECQLEDIEVRAFRLEDQKSFHSHAVIDVVIRQLHNESQFQKNPSEVLLRNGAKYWLGSSDSSHYSEVDRSIERWISFEVPRDSDSLKLILKGLDTGECEIDLIREVNNENE